MPRAIFFIKNSGRLMSIHLLPLRPSIPSSASICPRFCFLLLSLRASLYPCPSFLLFPPRASLYSHLCFHLSSPRARSASRHPRFTSRRSFSHDFSLQRHTLFGIIKPCIASSFPVIKPCFVPRHTLSRTKVCIASWLGWFVVSLRRAGVFLMPRHTLFGIIPCIASSFPVICLCFVPRHTFYRTKVCIANKVICLPPISISRYRFFLPKECVADRKHIP